MTAFPFLLLQMEYESKIVPSTKRFDKKALLKSLWPAHYISDVSKMMVLTIVTICQGEICRISAR